MDHDPWRRDLRVAIGAGDADAVVQALEGELPDDGLQLAGDGVLLGLDGDAAPAAELARRCAAALDGRSWEGDVELAAALRTAVGDTAASALIPLPVDLEELADVLDGAPGEGDGRLDRLTGDVWPAAAIDYALDAGDEAIDVDDPDHWLVIVPEGSCAGYDDMASFIATLSDSTLIDRLERAIDGRGAFRRFRDTLSATPKEFTRWHRFAGDRQRGRARAWLADHGYQPHPTPPEPPPRNRSRAGNLARCRPPGCGPGSESEPPGRLSTSGGGWPYGRWQSKRGMW